MAQEWENGNAVRQPAYEESNPFTPIDYAGRLQQSARRRRAAAPYQPGQLYHGPQPSAPPMAAPEYEVPSYLQPQQQWQLDPPAQGEEGAPYSASLFQHQPTAMMPNTWDVQQFASQPVQELLQPVEMPVWPEEEEQQETGPVYYSRADIPMRDPFAPAEPREDRQPKKLPPQTAQQHKQRPPVRLDRLLALIAAGIMLFTCAIVGGSLVLDLVRNEREVDAFRADFEKENGVDVYHAGAKVDLLPERQTYVPTSTPSPTVFAPTPSPTPIIPVYGALGLSEPEKTPEPAATPTPALRSRLTAYPKNPMCNITESLRKSVTENSDVIGRLTIPGLLDEMVMQRNNTYYLNHDASGVTAEHGAVFADQSCTLRLPPENLLLRGQGSVPGKTFAPLWQYVSGGSGFVSANMMARLATLYEEENYVLFAVIVADSNAASSSYFNYASNPTFTTDEAMMLYVENARRHSIYQFNVDVAPNDRLLTLATLGNGQQTLVLMYRMVRDTEAMGI
ncbi:MAG: hypothetical protein IKU70_05310 [Clostridia bacterium]|nr:hypothetical protein [Clostridia bacterium]